MYIYATETVELDRVIDCFANAKKRRLLLLLSRSAGMKLKFDRNIIAIIKLLVFKELPPPPPPLNVLASSLNRTNEIYVVSSMHLIKTAKHIFGKIQQILNNINFEN